MGRLNFLDVEVLTYKLGISSYTLDCRHNVYTITTAVYKKHNLSKRKKNYKEWFNEHAGFYCILRWKLNIHFPCNFATWRRQEPMSRSIQLHYIPVTAFSWTDLFLDRISSELDSYGSALTYHKTLIDVTASLDRNFYKRKCVLKIDQSVEMPWHRLSMGVACS